jgi:hypothetical protein
MCVEMRKTGVDVVGDIPWGSHFCLFYETRADLIETVAMAGLPTGRNKR